LYVTLKPDLNRMLKFFHYVRFVYRYYSVCFKGTLRRLVTIREGRIYFLLVVIQLRFY